MIAYHRLSHVPLEDALMVKTGTTTRRVLQVPSFPCCDDAASMSHADRRAALQADHELAFTYQMFPVIPVGIEATPLPAELWAPATPLPEVRRMWCRHLAADHYAPYDDRRSTLEQHGEGHIQSGLGLFGVAINPLASVVAFTTVVKAPNMLMHYVMAVALQYYTIKRGCFIRARTDKDAAHFSDALPPFVVALLREADCRVPKSKRAKLADATAALTDPITFANAEQLALTLSFPSFLLRVFRWMEREYPVTRHPSHADVDMGAVDAAAATLKHNAQDLCLEFCKTKLGKNWIQSLTCMRFREFMPDHWCERIGESRGGTPDVTPALKRSKFFQHPNACQLLSLDASTVRPANMLARIPYFFVHNTFRPDQPIMLETVGDLSVSHIEHQRLLIFRLLQFSPILSFNKGTQPKVTQEWGVLAAGGAAASSAAAAGASTRVFPTTAYQKWTEYDGYIRNTRANYSLYVPLANKGADAFLMVPNLHLSHDVPVVDNDTDMRNMSPEAFEWCRTHGTAFESVGEALKSALRLGRATDAVKKEEGREVGFPLAPGVTTAGPGWDLFLAWVVRSELEKGPSSDRHPYLLMLAVQLLTGREEDGVATAARLFSLGQMQQAYEEMVNNALVDTMNQPHVDHAMAVELEAARLRWDRCSPMPFPVDRLQRSVSRDRLWYFHFPVSHVHLAAPGCAEPALPWIDHFSMRERLARTIRQLDSVATLFDAAVLEELRACKPGDMTDATRQQLLAICTHFLQPATPMALAMSVAIKHEH